MTKAVRWGILGAAKFAREHMARAIHAAEGADFAAIATSDPAKAAPFRAFAPNIRVHLDYDALLADPDIDAVYIPLPNHMHVEWTLKALKAGRKADRDERRRIRCADRGAGCIGPAGGRGLYDRSPSAIRPCARNRAIGRDW